MARRSDTKDPARGKSRAQSKDERKQSAEGHKRAAQEGNKQARAKAVSGDAPRTKPGRPKPGRAQPTRPKAAKAASGSDDTTIESRLARLEQAVALQAERTEELLEKVEAVLTKSNQPVGGSRGGASGGDERSES
jgi:hypothetical protein